MTMAGDAGRSGVSVAGEMSVAAIAPGPRAEGQPELSCSSRREMEALLLGELVVEQASSGGGMQP